VRAAVVERLHLDVARLFAAVAILVDDARVGELDVTVLLREVVVDRPACDLIGRTIATTVAVGLAADVLLKELLMLAFQLGMSSITRSMTAPSSRSHSASRSYAW
jgi:hypothetical protein